jgi:hypothetical protein
VNLLRPMISHTEMYPVAARESAENQSSKLQKERRFQMMTSRYTCDKHRVKYATKIYTPPNPLKCFEVRLRK